MPPLSRGVTAVPLDSSADDWLGKAREDLQVASHLIAGGHWAAAAFHAQQAAEKALKAVVIHRSRSLERTHDLVRLANAAKASAAVTDHATFLTDFYVSARYPDVGGGVTAQDSDEALGRAAEVVRWASTQVS